MQPGAFSTTRSANASPVSLSRRLRRIVTKRIEGSRKRGTRQPDNTRYCGRPTEWNDATDAPLVSSLSYIARDTSPISNPDSSLHLNKRTEIWEARLLLQLFLRQIVVDLDQVDRVKSSAQLRGTYPSARKYGISLHPQAYWNVSSRRRMFCTRPRSDCCSRQRA